MAKLMILYGHPADPAAFEDYYASRHLPYASKHMPNVRGAENMRVTSTSEGGPAPYFRVSQLSYDTVDDLRSGIASEDGRSTIADLADFATGGATLLIVEENASD